MRKPRQQYGGVFLNRQRGIWYYRRTNTLTGKREVTPIGKLSEIPTKAKAIRASQALIADDQDRPPTLTFESAAIRYMAERMPKRDTTASSYRNYLENYCIPKWGNRELVSIEPMQVWRWIEGLNRSPKTKTHIRGVMRQVYEYAMLAGDLPTSRNPIDLVTVKGASKRSKPRRILTYDEWERFMAHLTAEPARTAVITCLCLGIRREEVWALKWSDFDFANGTVMIQRAIIGGKVYSVKTDASEAPLPLDGELIRLLLEWRERSEFGSVSDWVWASPWKAGEMPLYFNAMQRDYIIPASIKAGLGKIGWHTFRHTYRAWLNAEGTPLGVQKDLMRHANISTTANVYGAGVVQTMREFNSQVVRRVIQ